MDDHNRRRRRDDRPFIPPDPRSNEDAGQGREFSSSSERFRPSPLISSTPGARVAGGPSTYSSFYQESAASFSGGLSATPPQFQPSYQPDQRQQQGFGGYSPALMYNPTPQSAQNAVYDTNPQFQARQPGSMQMLPEGAGPFYQSEPSAASSASGLHHHASSSSSMYQHQHSPDNRVLQQGFSGGLSMGGLLQPESEAMQQEGLQPPPPEVEAELAVYETTVREVFQHIINNRLVEAGHTLLGASEWLLGHVGDLCFHTDDPFKHAERIQLWDNFNNAWLALFQKQKDLLESGQRVRHPHTLMTQEFINKMAKDLIRMCDAIEKHGLVDYQYGVAEERIMLILTECLDLQESIQGQDGSDPAPDRAPP